MQRNDTEHIKPSSASHALGWWSANGKQPQLGDDAIANALRQVARSLGVVETDQGLAVATGGAATLPLQHKPSLAGDYPLRAYVPALPPTALGSNSFRVAHGLKYAYVAGAMANGICSETMVEAMGKAGMLGFFGSAGLSLDRVEAAIDRIQRNLPTESYGFNLIYSPHEPAWETGLVELYLNKQVRRISAAAYIDLSLPLVRYRLTGITQDSHGRVVVPNQVVAKVSRNEVARRFLSPAPEALVRQLVSQNHLTTAQAELARQVPIADDLTAESDSGGHTDNRQANSLLPSLLALRDDLVEEYGYLTPPRVGAAGGVATPESAAAAFALGADYILTGSINQACVESGTSETVKNMLAQAGQADVVMAPAADMFEMGVKVQVLKWGTMFAMRAQKLYELYRAYNSLDELSATVRQQLERDYFRCSLEETWQQTKAFFQTRDPRQIERAERDPKYQLALVFRSYLGRSSDWANQGDPTRKADYQIWCGPAMGAFNDWVRGSFLEPPTNRCVVTVAMNLLVGAAVVTRLGWLRTQGITLPSRISRFRPIEMETLKTLTTVDR